MLPPIAKPLLQSVSAIEHQPVLQWLVILGIGCLTVVFSWGLFRVQEWGARARTQSYRNQLERLLAELEKLVASANQIYDVAAKIKDTALLDQYHGAIKMVESLLSAVKKLKPYDLEPDILQAPFFLCKDITERLLRIEQAMDKGIRGKPHEFMRAPQAALNAIGCHFCSRPFDAHMFGKVRVKIDNKSEEVAACNFCRQKLLSTRKARVLYFTEDGLQVHWSKAKSWSPRPEYWEINRDLPVESSKTPHLELVYSRVSHVGVYGQKNDSE